MIDWHISLVLFYILSVSKALSQRHYLRSSELPSSVIAAMNFILGFLPLAVILGLLLPHHVEWSLWIVILLTIDGLAIALYNKFSFRAIKRLPITHYQTLEQSFNVFVIFGGWVLLGEVLTATQFIGASFIIGAAVLSAFAARSKVRAQTIQPGTVRLVIVAAIILSTGLLAEKAALGHMDIGAYFIFGISSQALFVTMLASRDLTKKVRAKIRRSDIRAISVVSVLSAFSGFLYLYTLNTADNISLIISLSSFVLPLTALASYWLLNERANQKVLWASIALGVIGICITAL